MMGWDIYGMAQAGVLDIPLEAIDEERRTVVAPGSSGVALAYNSDLVAPDEVPTTWDEVADPKWTATSSACRWTSTSTTSRY
jgi:ABC-type Fe3+ transport system substrate-binding protein